MTIVSILVVLIIILMGLYEYRDYLKNKEIIKWKKEVERKNQIIADCQCVLDDFEIIVEILEDNFIEEEIDEMINKKKDLREKDLNKFLNGISKKD